jgi:hypothetical protein
VVSADDRGAEDAEWLRLTGTQIDFLFRVYANGPMPEILYFNGRRVALGDDLQQVQLFHDAKPGDRVVVAVKLLPTVDLKTFDHVEMKITFAASRPEPEGSGYGVCFGFGSDTFAGAGLQWRPRYPEEGIERGRSECPGA